MGFLAGLEFGEMTYFFSAGWRFRGVMFFGFGILLIGNSLPSPPVYWNDRVSEKTRAKYSKQAA
jgi:hypothetical protein